MDSNKAKKRALALPEMDSKKRKVDSFFPTRKQFLDSCLPQEFLLPMPIMKYIWSNPSSPEVYQKLIQCCKLFFIKNPILIMNGSDHGYSRGWKHCTGDKCIGIFCKCKHKKFDMEKLNDKKLWIAHSFCVRTKFGLNAKSNFVSQFIPKIFKYNVKQLDLFNQHLSFDELKFLLTGDVNEYFLTCNTVEYADGEEVELEKIIKLFAGAKMVWMNFYSQSHNAVCKSYDALIEAFATIRKAAFHLIPGVFDIPTFYQHLKLSKNRCLIDIYFSLNGTGLDEVIDEILKTKTFEFIPPVIKYFDQDKEKLTKMIEIQKLVAAKYR